MFVQTTKYTSMQKEKSLCPCCGANLNGRDERISKGIIVNLVKFREQALKSIMLRNLNKVHLAQDLNLTNNQYNNFQKLRYHGLIAHYKNPITKEYESGHWLLTKRGNRFAKNEIAISKKVVIWRNKIVERSEEIVKMSDVWKDKDEPFWYKHDDFGFDFEDSNDYKSDDDQDNQLELF
tara:strand:+ start:122 stop:658 length:537 start_codon:yes stop_codon:yes gene_type:complete